MHKFTISMLFLACGAAGFAGSGNAAALAGRYGFTFSGTVIESAGFKGPIAGVGEFTLDGSGGIRGSETFNVDGTVCFGRFAGQYTTDAAGNGKVSAPFTPVTKGCPSGTIGLTYTAVDRGNTLYFLQIPDSTGKVVSGIARKK